MRVEDNLSRTPDLSCRLFSAVDTQECSFVRSVGCIEIHILIIGNSFNRDTSERERKREREQEAVEEGIRRRGDRARETGMNGEGRIPPRNFSEQSRLEEGYL